MRLPLLTVSMIGAALLAATSARAADMVPSEPPAYTPPPAVAVPPPVVAVPPPIVAVAPPVFVRPVPPVGPPGCWRYGAVGWGWYPCIAGPPVYWHDHRYGYGWRPYWAGSHRGHRSYW